MDFKEENKNTYDQIAEDYSKVNFKPFWTNEFEKYKSLLPGDKVIDIGCGAGRDASMLAAAGLSCTGVDASQAMLNLAQERVPEATFKQMDFYHLDFPDDTFDGFWAAASFLHVPKADLGEVLLEAKRVIKSGGIGFISVKERDGMEEGVISQERFGKNISRFFAFYEKEEFNDYLAKAGFTIVEDAVQREEDERGTIWLGFLVQKS